MRWARKASVGASAGLMTVALLARHGRRVRSSTARGTRGQGRARAALFIAESEARGRSWALARSGADRVSPTSRNPTTATASPHALYADRAAVLALLEVVRDSLTLAIEEAPDDHARGVLVVLAAEVLDAVDALEA